MPSSVAWLDTSPDEQRRVRELISLFTEKETLDALGIGQIRDVFSDALFPGLSTVQTRAKYFFLVPWAYKMASASPGRSSVLEKAEQIQRQTIVSLKDLEREGRPQEGIVGARRGAEVRTLPSSIYWNGLRVLGILREDVAPDQIRVRSKRTAESDEMAVRSSVQWHPTLPAAPDGFPSRLPSGLDLSFEEAAWFGERVLQAVPESLFALLVAAERAPDPLSSHPWTDSMVVTSLREPLSAVVNHAKLFSHAIHGASILYAIEVAKAYEAAGYNTVKDPTNRMQEAHAKWVSSIEPLAADYASWNRDAFWGFIHERNPRVSVLTRRFVDSWLDVVVEGRYEGSAENSALQRLIAQREKQLKRGQARLENQKLLGSWGGEVGASLKYRWPEVRRILTDIHEGLSRSETQHAIA